MVVSGWLCEVMSAGAACAFGSHWLNILALPQFWDNGNVLDLDWGGIHMV